MPAPASATEPTLIIVQGLTIRRRMAAALDGSEPLDERLPLERVPSAGAM